MKKVEVSGSQPFLTRGTLKSKKISAAHLYLKKIANLTKRGFFPKKKE
jgi:hypothetical protein